MKGQGGLQFLPSLSPMGIRCPPSLERGGKEGPECPVLHGKHGENKPSAWAAADQAKFQFQVKQSQGLDLYNFRSVHLELKEQSVQKARLDTVQTPHPSLLAVSNWH